MFIWIISVHKYSFKFYIAITFNWQSKNYQCLKEKKNLPSMILNDYLSIFHNFFIVLIN